LNSSSNDEEIIRLLKSEYGNIITISTTREKRINILVEKQNLKEISTFLKKKNEFNRLISVSGVDYDREKVIEMVYHITSVDPSKSIICLKTRIDRTNPNVDSLVEVWRSAEYLERETYEMLGVIFEGHPKLERLFLPEDWTDPPPLRKDSKFGGELKFVPPDS
jgi:NADH-quinone oxidoreductase subunit C